MSFRIRARRNALVVAGVAVVWLAALPGYAQFPPSPAGPPKPAREAAPIDLTGYWVAVVTEDWRWRMITPPKGDYASVPLTAEGKKVADAWDPAKDEATGNACKSYGAAAIMRVPGRLHITWENENTLKIETDAGTQTRLLHFGKSQPPAEPQWQGHSVAHWEMARPVPGLGPAPPEIHGGSLQVVTTNMRPGYLRKNGVPYSGNAVVTEYFDRTMEPNGDSWLIVANIVEDPQYLFQPFVTSTHFKRLDGASGWNPSPCTAK